MSSNVRCTRIIVAFVAAVAAMAAAPGAPRGAQPRGARREAGPGLGRAPARRPLPSPPP